MEIAFHPLADLFPLLEGDELADLVADIRANGLREPIVLYQDQVLDGRNRLRACKAADVEPQFVEFDGDDPIAYAISLNVHRRHLTSEQKREVIAKLLKAKPENSNRQIAKQVKASPTTVGTVRSKMEQEGDVSRLDTRLDSKGRRQPSQKEKRSLLDRINPLDFAWNSATRKQRRALVRSRWLEIMRLRDEIGSFSLGTIVEREQIKQAADRAEARAESNHDGLEMRRAP